MTKNIKKITLSLIIVMVMLAAVLVYVTQQYPFSPISPDKHVTYHPDKAVTKQYKNEVDQLQRAYEKQTEKNNKELTTLRVEQVFLPLYQNKLFTNNAAKNIE